METVKVGIREFRENLASYVIEGTAPVAVTRHGDTVGLFIPIRRQPTQESLQALDEMAKELRQELANLGLTDEELVKDFHEWRAGQAK